MRFFTEKDFFSVDGFLPASNQPCSIMPQNTKTHETDLSFSRPTFTEDRFSIANYVENAKEPLGDQW